MDVDSNDLFSRNENTLVEARKDYYANAEILAEGTKNETLLKRGEYVGKNVHVLQMVSKLKFS